jgi:hypothetical protein
LADLDEDKKPGPMVVSRPGVDPEAERAVDRVAGAAAAGQQRRPSRAWKYAGAAAFAAVLVVCVPLYACLPPWMDNSFFDICARTVLRGDVLYRDIFLHGPPGMVLAQVAVRALVGWRDEALRLADLLLFFLSVSLLVRTIRGRHAAGVRLGVALVFFLWYVSISESCQCQPDGWMLLPALTAFWLRERQVEAVARGQVSARCLYRPVLEGTCWGTAFLIKPFVAVPALAVWLMAAALLRRAWRRLLVDGALVLAGGLVVAAATVVWLQTSGNWPYFIETMRGGWNEDYFATSSGLRTRFVESFHCFWPWSAVHALALPLAVATIVSVLVRKNSRIPRWPGICGDALLAALYLGWFLQANFLQRQYGYQLLPAWLLAVTLVAGGPGKRMLTAVLRWCGSRSPKKARTWLGRAFVGAVALWIVAWHPFFRTERLQLWTQCWKTGSTPELRDRLTLESGNLFATDWVPLDRVKQYLEKQGVRDQEVTCYAITTIPLYEELNLKPSTGFIFLGSAIYFFPHHRPEIRTALQESRERFVVSDLRFFVATKAETDDEDPSRPLLLPRSVTNYYPWSEPAVFRAGRYLVHRVESPPEQLRPFYPLPGSKKR